MDSEQHWLACHAAYLGLASEAKAKVVLAFTNFKYRYVGFVNGDPDGDTCIEPMGIGKIGMQAMVMHPGAGKTVNLMIAWPSGWNVQFKLWAPQKTWVSGEITGGKIANVTVSPASRVGDILVNGAAPTGITIASSDDPGGFIGGSGVGGDVYGHAYGSDNQKIWDTPQSCIDSLGRVAYGPPQRGETMTGQEVGKKYVALCQAGKYGECLDLLFSQDAVSVEAGAPPGVDRTATGLEAIHGKGKWWADNHTVHSGEVFGPYPHDDRFAVRFVFDITHKPSGKRMTMDEIGLFTVVNGKITREEFFYSGG